KMTHRTTGESTDIIASVTHPAEYKHGVTLSSFAGLTARHYLERFDAPRESLATVAAKNHENGVDNPHAQFQKEVAVDTILESPIIADPLRLYDFCPVTDGSGALLLCSEETAREYTDDYIVISGVDGATDTHVVHEREDPTVMGGVVESGNGAYEMSGYGPDDIDVAEDPTVMGGVVESGNGAYEMSGYGPDDIDVAELHDMFTILEFLQMEGLGFAEQGEAWELVEDGYTERDTGELPINTSGGLKSKGHPLGASGVAQAVEIYEQLTGEAGPRQVDADVGLCCNVGGFGNCVITTIMEAAR
ncbi:propanoyl-CoA C-acyltransferase, partial [Haloterrigena salina JCM 13891]